MTETDVNKYRNEILSLIKDARLCDAFSSFSKLLSACPNWEIAEELDKLQTSYKYMLMYMSQGSEDPQKEHIYSNLITSLYNLLVRYTNYLLSTYSRAQYYAIKQDFDNSGTTLKKLIEDFNAAYEKYLLYSVIPDENIDNGNATELHKNVEYTANRIFNYVWTKFNINDEEVALLKELMQPNSSISDDVKALWISAIFLSINKSYNERLLMLLFDIFFILRGNEELSIRTTVCIFFALHKYNHIVALSNQATYRLNELKTDVKFSNAIKLISLQFVRSCDTEKLTKIVHDKLMSGLMNAGPDFLKKFKGKKLGPSDLAEIESNPEWDDFLVKSGFADKIKEFSELQMEGGDVFMGTFSQLKTFPFFQDVANWFVPFTTSHSVVSSSMLATNKLMLNIISNAKFICDSDRFSFCLSLNSIPSTQRDAMLSQFDGQNEMLDEMKSTDILNLKNDIKQIVANYMQDIYRFFKLYSRHSEFDDPFSGSILHDTLLDSIICTPENLTLVGEYYLKHKYYDLAITFFKKETEITKDYRPNILQKLGFCYQNLKMYDEAANYYLKFEMFDNTNLWNTRHLAATYKALGNYEKALEYYHRAEDASPDNLSICLNIGHCLLELNRIEEALKYYYKVDYLGYSTTKALRPIAWCNFLLKNFSQSDEAYNKIIAIDPTSEDYMNFGHLKLAQNDMKNAILAYKESFKMLGNDFKKFTENFSNDRSYLSANGISMQDMALILDIIHYNL